MRTPAQVRAFTRPSEKMEQQAVYYHLRALGGAYWNLSQARATKQTEGLPDAWLAFQGRVAWWEAKREGGKQSVAQRAFQAACEAGGVTYLLGDRRVVWAWLGLAPTGHPEAPAVGLAFMWRRLVAERATQLTDDRDHHYEPNRQLDP